MLRKSECNDKDKKFQHEWIFDGKLAYCKKTGIWYLTNI